LQHALEQPALHRIVIDDKDSHSPSEIIATACVLFRGIVAEVA
jgi:hypothetical protein